MKSNPKDFRVDAAEKLRGEARYIRDEKIPNLWYGATIRSPYPRAKILKINFDPKFDWNSVVVVTAKEIPNNYVAMLENDMPFLAEEIVNYVGEPVVLIAGPDVSLLEEARQFINIDYQQFPYVLDMLKSETSDVHIYGENNLFKEIHISKGNLEKAKKQAVTVVEIQIETG